LTRDHKPGDQDERIRILKHGGKLYRDHEGTFNQIKVFRQVRVLPGNLNVSRTIGDIEVKLKKYGGLPGMISSLPDITAHPIESYKILLLGSDGLF
jgi:protein phosphatase PTC2/3